MTSDEHANLGDANALKTMLVALALDLRWAWSHASDDVWQRLNGALWSSTRNPWVVLQSVSEAQLKLLAADRTFVTVLAACEKEQSAKLARPSWFSRHNDRDKLKLVAYFSMEFGLSEALPIYAGGLGVLAGDLLKSGNYSVGHGEFMLQQASGPGAMDCLQELA